MLAAALTFSRPRGRGVRLARVPMRRGRDRSHPRGWTAATADHEEPQALHALRQGGRETAVPPAACRRSARSRRQVRDPTTCGQAEAVACCTMSDKGKLKAGSSRVTPSAGGRRSGVRSALDAALPGGVRGRGRDLPLVQQVFGQAARFRPATRRCRRGWPRLDSEEVRTPLVGKPSVHEQAKSLGLRA